MQWKDGGTRYLVRRVPKEGGEDEIFGLFDSPAEAELVLLHVRDQLGLAAQIEECRVKEPLLRPRGPDRHAALIEATIDLIAAKGYSRITVADVAARAKVSAAHVFAIFASKTELLAAALRQMESGFLAQLDAKLARAGDDPALILRAVVEADLEPEYCTERMLKAYTAFRSEAREIYNEIVGPALDRDTARIEAAFGKLTPGRARANAMLIRATLDGLLRMMESYPSFNPAGALRVAFDQLHALAPAHFAPGNP